MPGLFGLELENGTEAQHAKFNLAPGTSLGQATQLISQMQQRIGMPASVLGQFAGTAEAFQKSLSSEPLVVLAALAAIYIVLGVLNESLVGWSLFVKMDFAFLQYTCLHLAPD